jgi:hypothetical protein
MEINLKIAGCILIALASLHVIFPSYFEWKNDLQSISLINREIIKVHTLFIGLVVFLMGLLCVTSAAELTTTHLGRKICIGLGIFWLVRLFVQFFVYSAELWRGKKLETAIHILFSLLWVYFSLTFLLAGIK